MLDVNVDLNLDPGLVSPLSSCLLSRFFWRSRQTVRSLLIVLLWVLSRTLAKDPDGADDITFSLWIFFLPVFTAGVVLVAGSQTQLSIPLFPNKSSVTDFSGVSSFSVGVASAAADELLRPVSQITAAASRRRLRSERLLPPRMAGVSSISISIMGF